MASRLVVETGTVDALCHVSCELEFELDPCLAETPVQLVELIEKKATERLRELLKEQLLTRRIEMM